MYALLDHVIDCKYHVNEIVDGTHTVSCANLYRPVPALKKYAKRLRAQLYRCDESLNGKIEKDNSIQCPRPVPAHL